MTLTAALPLAVIAVAVLLPLAREYIAFRREWALGRVAALGTAFTLFPSLWLGLAVTAPLAGRPALQWLATVVVTILAYSLAVAVLRPALAPAPRRSR
jgi:hypothetical protein